MTNAMQTVVTKGARFSFKSSVLPVTVVAIEGEIVRFDNGNVMSLGILRDGLSRGFWSFWKESTAA